MDAAPDATGGWKFIRKQRGNQSAKFLAFGSHGSDPGEKTIEEIAAHGEVHPNQVAAWKSQALENLAMIFAAEASGSEDCQKLCDAKHAMTDRAVRYDMSVIEARLAHQKTVASAKTKKARRQELTVAAARLPNVRQYDQRANRKDCELEPMAHRIRHRPLRGNSGDSMIERVPSETRSTVEVGRGTAT